MRNSIALLDEAHRLVDELLLIGDEGEQHPDRHAPIQDGERAEVDHREVLGAEDDVVHRLEPAFQSFHSGIGGHHLGVSV
jgi:hypothetical protein